MIPDPYFVLYEYQALLLGGKPVFFDTYPDFTLREADLRAALSDETKVILINSPNNPTGAVYSADELEHGGARCEGKEPARLLRRHIRPFCLRRRGPGYFGPALRKYADLRRFLQGLGHDGMAPRLCGRPDAIIDSMVTMQQYVF